MMWQQLSNVDTEYLLPEAGHVGKNGNVANHLYNCGREKLVEQSRIGDEWTVLPLDHNLVKLLLAPANSMMLCKSNKDGSTANVWWTLPPTSKWAG